VLTPQRRYKPSQILVAPQDLRVSDPTTAEAILSGQLLFGGRHLDSEGRSPFEVAPPSGEFAQKLHGFGWMRHFRGLPQAQGSAELRRLIGDWIARRRTLPAAAFEGEATARRVMSFISQSPLIVSGASPEFYQSYLAALDADIARLRKALPLAHRTAELTLATALLYAALGCKGLEPLITPACERLNRALRDAILPDGGHRSRNPARTIDLAFDLLPLKQALGVRERAMPKEIAETLSAIIRMLRTVCHRDGRLLTMNGAGPAVSADLAILHAYDRADGAEASTTGASRYLRLDAGRTTLFMDGGTAPQKDWSTEHHCAPLALEWSHFNQRVVINCGAPPPGMPELSILARRTAAHSTLTIDDADAAHFDETSLAAPILKGPKTVDVTRLADEAWTLIDASHDGYKPDFARLHRRKIALSADGTVIAGEDRLERTGRNAPLVRDAVVRFHLAPEIRPNLASSGENVALDAGAAGIWLFSAQGARIYVEESIIFATFRGRQRTTQLVVEVPDDGKPLIWRFTKMRENAP
jgi:uncharacterized heparinase superfamily protein